MAVIFELRFAVVNAYSLRRHGAFASCDQVWSKETDTEHE